MTEELQIINEIEKAAKLCEKSYEHDEIINVISGENDFEKQICLLKLDYLADEKECNLLVFQLTEHHGLIREAAAIKISEFLNDGKYKHLFLNNYCVESFLKAVNDINPNICRLICSVLHTLLSSEEEYKKMFLNLLYKRFDTIFCELEKLKRSNWYTKKLFNLYWCLEALAMLNVCVDENLESVLTQACKVRDYTIREKAAMVISSLKGTSDAVNDLKTKLKQDDNFYVKRYAAYF